MKTKNLTRFSRMNLLAGLAAFACGTALSQTPFSLNDNFSNPGPWTQVGNNVTINNGVVNYLNGAADGQERRVHRIIGPTLDAEDTWKAWIDFAPTAVGANVNTGHNILALTAGDLEPISQCQFPNNCTNNTNQNQDGIMVNYITENPTNGNIHFRLIAKDGVGEIGVNTQSVALPPSNFRVVMERTCLSTIDLMVYTLNGSTVGNLVASTSITLPVGTDISGLTHVQHANVARGMTARQLTGTIDNLNIEAMLWEIPDCSQSDLSEDYSSSAGWSTVGSNVNISNGSFNYINGAADATARRMYRPIGSILDETTTFSAAFTFMPTSVGSGVNTGHAVLSLTAGTNESISDCPGTGSCVNPPNSVQDGIVVTYITKNPSTSDIYFKLLINDDGTHYQSDYSDPVNTLPASYRVILRRESAHDFSLQVYDFTGGTLGNLVTSLCHSIPTSATVNGLSYIQHGNVARGMAARQLNGSIDDLCMSWNMAVNSPNVWAHKSNDNAINSAIGSPTEHTGIAIAPDASGSTLMKFTAAVWDSPITGSYEIQWYEDNTALLCAFQVEGTDPDVAYYANPDLVHVCRTHNNEVYVDAYALNSTTGVYDAMYNAYVDDGIYPNIDANSNGDGILCWENGGEIYIQPVGGVSSLFTGLKENVGPGSSPDVVLSDNGVDVIVTYINSGNLEIRKYDYTTMFSPFGPPVLTASHSIPSNGDNYDFPRIASPRNSNFYNQYADYTIVAERSSGTDERIEAVSEVGGTLSAPYLVNGGFETCSNSFPVVTYNMETLVMAWSSNYGGCANTLNIMGTPPEEDVIMVEYDPTNLTSLSGDFYEVNANQSGFGSGRPALNATYDGNYGVQTGDAREAMIFYNSSDVYWKKRGAGGNYKSDQANQSFAESMETSFARLLTNPVENEAIITGSDLSSTQVMVSDVTGRIVDLNTRRTEQNITIEMAGLKSGVYLITCFRGSERMTFKVLKN
ncbi:MAG: T9SS type A sorting domain-containing protein [Cryomorphaceae bacterium]